MTRSSFRAASALLVVAVAIPACIVHEGEPHPLYTNDEPPQPPNRVARLFGPIAAIDGKDVSHLGKSFSLLPGCHIVKLAPKTGQINAVGSGGYVASLPPALYAFRMRPTHTYEIEVVLDSTTGPVGPITIRAWDRDANGGALEQSPVTSTVEIDDCMKWRP